MKKYFNERIETASEDQIKKIQSERLIETVKRVYENVPSYAAKMKEAGVEPEDIKSVEDLPKLPFSCKQDLRDNYPFGLFAVPMKDIVRLHASSGTTGKQIVVGYTQSDLDTWAGLIARAFTAAGADSSDIIQISYGYGLFTGGLGIDGGAKYLGAATVPMSTGNTNRQLTLMKDFGTTLFCSTPSYAMYVTELLENSRMMDTLKLKVGIFGAEPWTENMRHELEQRLHIKAYDIYGLTEISGPGVGGECECQNGTHISEDLFYPEIIDPVTLQPVGPGEKGELVFTTLDKWGMPMIRYRTRDLTSLNYDVCDCGRTTVRMGKIMGRSDDMMIIRGVNVFPSQIEAILLEFPEYEPYFLIEVDRVNNTDTFQIQVEVKPEYYTDRINLLVRLKQRLASRIQSVIGLQPDIRIVEPNTIERTSGKSKRAIDHRKLQ